MVAGTCVCVCALFYESVRVSYSVSVIECTLVYSRTVRAERPSCMQEAPARTCAGELQSRNRITFLVALACS